ncbi:MAG: Tat pathway signal protein [Sphingomonas sp.]|nr:Tat pathway signal protein [Sphingomonas sp.]
MPEALRAQTVAAGGATNPADAQLNSLFDKVFAQTLQRSPELATSLGMDKGANAALKHRLTDQSAAGKATARTELKQAIAAIRAVDPASLSTRSKLDREVILYSLESRAVPYDRFKLDGVQRPFTIFQQGGSYFSTPDFLNSSHTINNAADCEAYLDRLGAFAKRLDQDTANQKEEASRGYLAPDFSLDLTLGQMAKLRGQAAAESGLAQSVAKRAAAKNINGDWQARASKIVEADIYPALDRQIALIKALRPKARSTAGIWDVPQGDAIYAAALEQATTTKYTPAEVHQMGLDQVAEITAQLDTILRKQGLTRGNVGARLNELNVRPEQVYPDTAEGRAALIKGLNEGNAAMTAKLGQAILNPPSEPLDIRAVPVDIQDGASNGYYSRAALDGSRPAIYWINLKNVGDWPKYSLPSLTYHEGVPGHHLQISIAQKAPQPLLRNLSFFSGYSEGWALYAESLADELGGYADDLERAGFLQSYLFRAARLVIDTGIHTKRWTRDQATDYMVETVGFARPRSQREIERYCTQPGQACSYKVGHAAWVRARETAQKLRGDKFDLRQFHEVLQYGAVPLTILQRLVEEQARAA